MSTTEMRVQFYYIARAWEFLARRPHFHAVGMSLAQSAKATAARLRPGARGLDPEYAEHLLKIHHLLLRRWASMYDGKS